MKNFEKDKNKFIKQNENKDHMLGNLMNEVNANFSSINKKSSPKCLNQNVRILNMMQDYLSQSNDKRKKVKQMKRKLEDLCIIKEKCTEHKKEKEQTKLRKG